MVMTKSEEVKESDYSLNMVLNNQIPGLLKLELRAVDNISQYYYNITSKQSISWILEKGNISKAQIKKVMTNMIDIMEQSREYLLEENDFVLNPEHIFINLINWEITLCYFPGYNQNIQRQLRDMIAYFMNKIDHKDEGAVLLIYGLYKVSMEEDCTFDRLKLLIEEQEVLSLPNEELQNYAVPEEDIPDYSSLHKVGLDQKELNMNISDKSIMNKNVWNKRNGNNENHSKEDRNKGDHNKKNQNKENYNKVNQNKVNQKKEIQKKKNRKKENLNRGFLKQDNADEKVLQYSYKTIIFCGVSVIIALLFIIMAAFTGFIYHQGSKHIDYVKAFAVLLIIGGIEAYALNHILGQNKPIEQENNQQDTTKSPNVSGILGPITDKWSPMVPFSNSQESVARSSTTQPTLNQSSVIYSAMTQSALTHEVIFPGEHQVPYDEAPDYKASHYKEENSLDDMENENTVVLGYAVEEKKYKLSPLDKNLYQEIELKEFPFFIGKLKMKVDFTIEHNSVSRFHAKVDKISDSFYISDLNSTNGTFVNQIRLEVNEKKLLQQGDEIAFADIKYQFILS
jgi:FOG: FHA domain